MGRKAVVSSIVFLLVSLSLFSLFSIKYVHQPVAKMELFFLKAGESQYTDGIPKRHSNKSVVLDYQTHLYPVILGEMFRLLGPSCFSARIVGEIFGAISLILLFFIIYYLLPGAPDERVGFAGLGCLLFATSPASLYGFSSIDIDNGLLVPLYMATSLMFILLFRSPTILNAAGVAFITALMVWAKVMNIPMLIAAPLIYLVFGGLKASTKIKLALAMVFGFILFFITWGLYCKTIGLDYKEPFKYMLFAFNTTTGETAKSKTGLVTSLAIYMLWLNPFFILLLAGGAVSRGFGVLKSFRIENEDIFPVFSAMIVFGYLMIGGVVSGFPRYACPAVPLGIIFFMLSARKTCGKITLTTGIHIAVAALCAAIIYYHLGDLIYALRYTIRENSALAISNGPLFKAVAFRVVVSFVSFAGIFILFYSRLLVKKPALIILAFLLGTNIASLVRYQLAGYDVGYQHGGKGTREVVDMMQKRINGESGFLLPVEIVYYLKPSNPSYAYGDLTDSEHMMKRLADPSNQAFVYSIVTQSVSSYKSFSTDPEIVNELKTNYTLTQMGTFKVWIRNKTIRTGTVAPD